MLAYNLYEGCEQFNITESIALSMGHQFTQANHAGFGAAFQFMKGANASERLQNGHAVDARRVAAHGIDNVAVGFFDKTRVGPTKGEGDGDSDARYFHFR